LSEFELDKVKDKENRLKHGTPLAVGRFVFD